MATKNLREPAVIYARNTEIPTFFGQPMLKGTYSDLGKAPLDSQTPAVLYTHLKWRDLGGKCYCLVNVACPVNPLT